MKSIAIIIGLFLSFSASAKVLTQKEYHEAINTIKLPELNSLKKVVLMGSHGCNDEGTYGLDFLDENILGDDFEIFLNYSCGSPMELQSGIRGPSLGLIADIGKVNITELNWYQGLTPKWQVGHSHDFRRSVQAKEGHSYSVIINNWRATGLMLLTVDKIEGDKVYISYIVKQYTLVIRSRESDGFSYDNIAKP